MQCGNAFHYIYDELHIAELVGRVVCGQECCVHV